MQGGGLPQAAKHSLAVAFSEINFKNSPGDFLQKVPLAAVYDAFLFSPFGRKHTIHQIAYYISTNRRKTIDNYIEIRYNKNMYITDSSAVTGTAENVTKEER